MRRVPFVINIFNEFSIEMQLVCTKGQKYEFFRVGGCVCRGLCTGRLEESMEYSLVCCSLRLEAGSH